MRLQVLSLPRERGFAGLGSFAFRWALALLIGLSLGGATGAVSATTAEIESFRTKTAKWVETRQLISAERTDWEEEEEILKATRKLLEQRKKALVAEIAELEESNTASDDERRDLLLERGNYQRASGTLAKEIRGLEEAVLALLPRLPAPLLEKLDLLIVQIPKDPDTTRISLGQRLMNVLGVLAQAEKWNGTANFVAETRDVGAEQKIQVRTLYWGLGQAIYVDAKGETAGIGRPDAEGWDFADQEDLADDAGRLLDIYEGNTDSIGFVDLPVEIR